MEKNLHEGHRKRVKERFIIEGLDSFNDHQVLELLMFYAIPMKDTNELAHKMIKEFGSLSGLFEANPKDICNKCGVSENSAILISLIPSLARRYFKGKWGEKIVLNSASKAGEYSVSLFVGKHYENFYIICLDSQNKVNHSAVDRNLLSLYQEILGSGKCKFGSNLSLFRFISISTIAEWNLRREKI